MRSKLSVADESLAWCRGDICLGLAWGLALWVSLWEPLILWLGVTGFGLAVGRRRWWNHGRKVSFVAMGSILLVALALEGVRITPPGWFEGEREAFARWAEYIGELQPVGAFSRVLGAWGSGFAFALPVLLGLAVWRRGGERAVPLLAMGLLAGTWVLTATQARWGYFFALTIVLSIVIAWPATRALRWISGIAFAAGLWWTAAEIENLWFPRGPWAESREARITANRDARAVARRITAEAVRTGHDGAIAAPWWDAASLVYRTGRPALTGSSHQAIDGDETYQLVLRGWPARGAARHLTRLGIRWLVWRESGSSCAYAAPMTDEGNKSRAPSWRSLYEEMRAISRPASALELVRLDEATNPPWQLVE